MIELVLKNIAHKQVDRLPQRTALCNMMIECLSIAQAQLGEELSHDDGEFYTLQTDRTTKYGHQFGTYDIATTDTKYRLQHVFSRSAQITLETFNEILDDLDVFGNKAGLSDVSFRIISKVKNTMSDRHAAEKLFTDALAEYRADIFPEIVCGWESLSSEERDELTRMNNFFCGLHFLIGLANAAEETLKVWESTVEDQNTEQKSSGTQRLIHTACKAFNIMAQNKQGVPLIFVLISSVKKLNSFCPICGQSLQYRVLQCSRSAFLKAARLIICLRVMVLLLIVFYKLCWLTFISLI